MAVDQTDGLASKGGESFTNQSRSPHIAGAIADASGESEAVAQEQQDRAPKEEIKGRPRRWDQRYAACAEDPAEAVYPRAAVLPLLQRSKA